jgi:Mn-dependent DtxR family transcriptional regulator
VRAETAGEPTPVKYVPTQRFTTSLSPELQRAYEAWQEGMSLRDFGRALGVSKDTAGKLLQRLKDKKAVDVTGRKLLG